MSEIDNVILETNKSFYKYNMTPDKWFYKSKQLVNDSNILYDFYEKHRLNIMNKLEVTGVFNREFVDYREFDNLIGSILLENSEISFPNYRSFYLLYGFGIENGLKGILIAQNSNLIDESKLHNKIKTHNLNKLAESTSIKLTKEEKICLKNLSDLIRGYGRYPVKSSFEVNDFDLGDDCFDEVCIKIIHNTYEEDKNIMDGIYKKIEICMENAARDFERYMKSVFGDNITFFGDDYLVSCGEIKSN